MRTVNKKIFLISLQKINFFLILIFTVLHIAYIDTPFVNLEWVYRQGTEYFLKSDNDALEKYFFYQANPLTYSFLTSKLVEWTEFNQFAVYRIPALVGGILLLTTLSRYHNPWLVLIVGLNPMIWIYAGRSYSELLAVDCMSIAYLCRHSILKAGPIAALAGVV